MRQVLHDGFAQHVWPVLAPLGFVQVTVPSSERAPGWTVVRADCALESGGRWLLGRSASAESALRCDPASPAVPAGRLRFLRVELAFHNTSPPRFHFTGPTGELRLECTEADPASPKRPTVAHAFTAFETAVEVREGGEVLAARRRIALEFLAAELAATSAQLVALVPELRERVSAAAPTWGDAGARARTLWQARKVRSASEERPVEGKFTFFGAALVVVEAEGKRFTFRGDTSRVDRSLTPIVSGWVTSPAGTRDPTVLRVGDVVLQAQ